LFPDLDTFEKGDKTKVGTKGAALSGGQHQRIAIARALCARPDLLVFEDIFSGLDQKTEGIVFQKVFGAQGILKRMAVPVVLCKKSIKNLAAADYTIALAADGTICEHGKYEDLLVDERYVFSLRGKSYINGHSDTKTESAQERLKKCHTTGEEADLVEDQSRQRGDLSIYPYDFRSRVTGLSFRSPYSHRFWIFPRLLKHLANLLVKLHNRSPPVQQRAIDIPWHLLTNTSHDSCTFPHIWVCCYHYYCKQNWKESPHQSSQYPHGSCSKIIYDDRYWNHNQSICSGYVVAGSGYHVWKDRNG
jgi:hypothetical protein